MGGPCATLLKHGCSNAPNNQPLCSAADDSLHCFVCGRGAGSERSQDSSRRRWKQAAAETHPRTQTHPLSTCFKCLRAVAHTPVRLNPNLLLAYSLSRASAGLVWLLGLRPASARRRTATLRSMCPLQCCCWAWWRADALRLRLSQPPWAHCFSLRGSRTAGASRSGTKSFGCAS